LYSKVGQELEKYMEGSSCGLIEVLLWNFLVDNEGRHKTSELLLSPLAFEVCYF
jgi:hypothetical protein